MLNFQTVLQYQKVNKYYFECNSSLYVDCAINGIMVMNDSSPTEAS